MSHLVYITPFGETDGVTLSRLGCNCGSGSGSVLYVVQQLIKLASPWANCVCLNHGGLEGVKVEKGQ